LIGAAIRIPGTTTGATADFDGKFQFLADEGTITLEAKFVGYGTKILQGIKIKAKNHADNHLLKGKHHIN